MARNEAGPLSLLRPAKAGAAKSGRRLAAETDLNLAAITRTLDFDGRHGRFVASVLAALPTDPAIISYRQDILADLLAQPDLVATFTAMLPTLGDLASAGRGGGGRWGDKIPLHNVGHRLAELDSYVGCVESLSVALEKAAPGLKSEGLRDLTEWLAATRAEPLYRRLSEELPGLRARLETAGSVTLGLNLNAQLQPESATILSLNPTRFGPRNGLFERLFGERTRNENENGNGRGLGSLYRASEGEIKLPEHELFRELSRLLERVAAPVAEALGRYTRLNSAGLAALEPELAFWLGAVRMSQNLSRAGLPLCRPTILAEEERTARVKGLYSLDLALRLLSSRPASEVAESLVPNELDFGLEGTIFVLTGPNSGGKTTYTRAVGQAQVLFQAGLLVPGTEAALSPVDGIFSHFAAAERQDAEGGRLAEELERLARLFRSASRASLVLLNEPLASTDHTSARLLSRDVLAGLRLLGARAIFVTHIHELVEDLQADEGVDGLAGSRIVSLVAGVAAGRAEDDSTAPTYTIRPGRPQALGYATDLARRYGLSFGQIAQVLRERGLD